MQNLAGVITISNIESRVPLQVVQGIRHGERKQHNTGLVQYCFQIFGLWKTLLIFIMDLKMDRTHLQF